MQTARIITRSLLSRNTPLIARKSSYDSHEPVVLATMNDMPIPEGDWQESYQKKNRKQNIILISSFVFFATCLTIMKESELVHFNWAPPKTYE